MNTTPYTKQFNTFGTTLLKKYMSADNNCNIVYSPFSIIVLLAIAADATNGETSEEILNTVFPGVGHDDINSLIKELQKSIAYDKTFTSANAVILQNEIKDTIVPGYETHLSDAFDGKLFASDDIADEVNTWVREKTNGLIDHVIDESGSDGLLSLINAVAFEAEWEKQYEENDVINLDFRNSDGSVSKVKMLSSDESEYIENEIFTGFAKPYKGSNYYFMALLPKKNYLHISDEDLDIDFTELFNKREQTEVDTTMPKFNYSFENDLTGICKELGINRVFSENADFSNISSEWLKAKSLIHKARIEVDRKGTKAAAATMMFAVAGDAGSFNKKWICLNRPFIYAIIHTETGLPIFTGVVNHLDGLSDEDRKTIDEKVQIYEPTDGRPFMVVYNR